LIFLTNLCKQILNSLEGSTHVNLLRFVAHLLDGLLILSLPRIADPVKLRLQSLAFPLRNVNIRYQLLHLIIVLVVVMHFSQGLLILHLVLSSLRLDLQHAYLLIDGGQTLHYLGNQISSLLDIFFTFLDLMIPFFPQSFLLPQKLLSILLKLPLTGISLFLG
jgi:hypothetical protein